jgi:hypothetical protein
MDISRLARGFQPVAAIDDLSPRAGTGILNPNSRIEARFCPIASD